MSLEFIRFSQKRTKFKNQNKIIMKKVIFIMQALTMTAGVSAQQKSDAHQRTSGSLKTYLIKSLAVARPLVACYRRDARKQNNKMKRLLAIVCLIMVTMSRALA